MINQYASIRPYAHLSRTILIIAVLTIAARSLAFAGLPSAGQPAPDFALSGLLDGQTVSLKDLKGKVILMNIWASWCSSCKDEMEDLMAVQEQYGPRGFAFVAVNIDNASASAVEFMDRLETKMNKRPVGIFLYDKDKLVPKAYLQRAMPTSYLIDREGKYRKIYLGSFSKSALAALKVEIEEALK